MISIAESEVFTKRGQLFMRWARMLLIVSGILAISYVGLTLLGARRFQKDASLLLDKQIHAKGLHRAQPLRLPIKEGDVLGRIEIPRIGISVIVLQGTKSQTLRLGAGHIDGTPLPGEAGNIGIAGHRDTFFRGLKNIHKDDEILLQSVSGVSKYQVDWIQITAPGDSGIISSKTESALTLVTCYPFHFIGAAPERFIVHAHRE
jgi:sortase A